LRKALQDKVTDVRIQAAGSIAQLVPGDEEALKVLIGLLADKDSEVRCETAYVTWDIGPSARKLIPHLIPMLGDSEAYNRRAAAIAIEMIDPKHSAAVKALGKALTIEKDPEARKAIVDALAAGKTTTAP